MALLRITYRLLRAVHTHYANRRRDASLRDCDPRMLKDIGLRWERGKLVPLYPERFATKRAVATLVDGRVDAEVDAGAKPATAESAHEICPRCGARLA
ncbi:hypothetical protein [Billgrantia montanilacus]|uniref:DUF1127 domain-containing protein n=1 Tax=Billgrantia montanilacus TaxID=2282305 RepID=A0A368TP19_9GAMM|nr:hypothetical protein [Halomonas montanilacus]RCV86280.1 hypothetical protein DU505_21290 [Halomonas montanilacus]